MMTTRLACLGALLVSVACGGPPAVSSPATPPQARAPSPLDALEQRLLGARSLRVHAVLGSEGALQTRFAGDLVIATNNRARVWFEGTAGARTSFARLVSDGTTMRGGDKDTPFTLAVPPALREGLVLAVARLGVLHDVARIARGRAPDGIDGKAREWLRVVSDPTSAPGETIRGAATTRLDYQLLVGGETRTDETLWLDASTGLPVRRDVVVHFPEGDMRVREEYAAFAIDGKVDDAEFAVAP